MSRPLRITYPGAFYHITSRGNAKANIFSDDADHDQFLFILAEVIKKYNWRCHAYCLMNNHYHLLIETVDPTLSEGMRCLNGEYTQWYNAIHDRVGHVFQGRFKAFLIEEGEYLMNAARYVVLNPVRAKLVIDPADYVWSSYRATAGLDCVPDWLLADKVLGYFADNKPEAWRQYLRFVLDGVGLASPFSRAEKEGVLGSEQFIGEIRDLIDPSIGEKEVGVLQRWVGRPSLERIFDGIVGVKERDAGIILALNVLHYSGAEVGSFLGLARTTVCRIAKLAQSDHHTSQT